ncbi:MAG: phage integrase N-terminal SAM-like domain-containing protein [Balneolales bacterium]|nr:phage integrase N-terminal SAM-like domain-containing protein [Balneolales bacterium]
MNETLLSKYIEALKREGYHPRTRSIYQKAVSGLCKFHYCRSAKQLSEAEIRLYLLHLQYYRKIPAHSLKLAESAILFLYRRVLNQVDFHLESPGHPATKQLSTIEWIKLYDPGSGF